MMLNPQDFAAVSAYARQMRVPVQQCIDEAIADWLTIVAPARVSQDDKPGELIRFAN